jgi:hypothetical protein
MTSPSDAEMAHLEAIARRLVIGHIEQTRDRAMGTEVSTLAISELLGEGTKSFDQLREDLFQVIWFLGFFAASGAIGHYYSGPGATAEDFDRAEYLDACEKAIGEYRQRLLYLAKIQ